MGGKKRQSSNAPRFDPENRRLSRFYEALVLLHILDPYGEQRIDRSNLDSADPSQMSIRDLRRAMVDQLSYVCDNIAGGDKVTAIALESTYSQVTFWVTANTNVSHQTKLFLEKILSKLKSCQTEQQREVNEREIQHYCIEFNVPRIKDYRRRLRIQLNLYLDELKSSDEPDAAMLYDFLLAFRLFDDDDVYGLCRLAYEKRFNPAMRVLQSRSGDPSEVATPKSKKHAMAMTRHYIGRLGSHIRAAKIMSVAGLKIPSLFASYVVETRPAPKPPRLPPPIDEKTRLASMVVRMLPNGSDKLSFYQEALDTMDRRFHIMSRFLDKYQDRDFRPRVHAELNLLHFFHTEGKIFVDNDKYIGCSKPACYCCYHYIREHPGDFVSPSSHGKRYLAWRPPDLSDSADEDEVKLHRKVLSSVIIKIKRDALENIESRKGPSAWHPDSTTGITPSLQHLILGHDGERSERTRVFGVMNTIAESVRSVPSNTSLAMSATWPEPTAAGPAQDRPDEQHADTDDSGSDGGVFIGNSSI